LELPVLGFRLPPRIHASLEVEAPSNHWLGYYVRTRGYRRRCRGHLVSYVASNPGRAYRSLRALTSTRSQRTAHLLWIATPSARVRLSYEAGSNVRIRWLPSPDPFEVVAARPMDVVTATSPTKRSVFFERMSGFDRILAAREGSSFRSWLPELGALA
jgi:hypothetical protein